MTDIKRDGEKTLSVAPAKPLSLKRSVEQGVVRQSFSHGRSKAVVVEKKKRRFVTGAEGKEVEAAAPAPAAAPPPRAERVQPRPQPQPEVRVAPRVAERTAAPKSGVVLRTLTDEEKDARTNALAEARVREAEERVRAEEDSKRRAVEDARLAVEREAAERRKAEEEARRRTDDDVKRRAEAEAKKRLGESEAPAAAAAATAAPSAPAAAKASRVPPSPVTESDDDERSGARARAKTVAPKPAPRTEERRRGRLTLSNALNDDERNRSLAALRRRKERARGHVPVEQVKISREVVVPETITIQELANRMAERGVDVIKILMGQGQMLKITDAIDADTAQLIAEEMGHSVKRVAASDVETGLFTGSDEEGELLPRSPIVTIMGHVDHGKTSLLDAIRQANVVSGEAGGITQHIGAYQVESPNGGKVTFIDTPGHAAFTAMRARGAKATDIVVLVVAADDGVMPQTVEAIHHAKAAGVPIIVAINKIDKPGIDAQRVRTELLQHEIVVESMGGDVQDIEVSALKRINLDGLLDAISLQAEILELKANPDRAAEGVVVEAKLDRGRGPVATVLVQRGTIRIGDIVVAGSEMGRVRALIDDQGRSVTQAGPSMPVEVLGFNGAPDAGDQIAVVENEARAREIADYRADLRRERQHARVTARVGSLEQMMNRLKSADTKLFPLVIKGDVQGSVEAIIGALEKMSTDEVEARIIHAGVGGITESDVTLAAASETLIIGFNVRANKQARDAAEREGVEIRYYNIIYNLVDDVKAAMSGLLPPERREEFLGNAEILEVFNITKVGKVAGCRVTEGVVQRGAKVRLIRDNVVVHEGTLSTLKRFKDEVREVVVGQECGMAFEKYEDMRQGDVIECFRVEEVQRTL